MLPRIALAALIAALCLLAVKSLFPSVEAYCSMAVEKVDGRPYLMLETCTGPPEAERSFSIFTPHGADLNVWDPVVMDLRGPANGFFEVRAPAGATAATGEAPGVRLGVFHFREAAKQARISYIDLSSKPAQVTMEALPFDWALETAADLKNATYVFGVKQPPPVSEDAPAQAAGELKVARFDGKTWEELDTPGPQVTPGSHGFLLKALELQGRIKVLWRSYGDDGALDPSVEGSRIASEGPVRVATFDGTAFSGEVTTIDDLPRGNLAAWNAGDQINLLIQIRPPPEKFLTANGKLEIWSMGADNATRKVDDIASPETRVSLFPLIAAVYVQWHGQDYILRSNWQSMAVWTKDAEEHWVCVKNNPAGLPRFEMESLLLGLLGLCLGVIALGAGLAFRRRKQAWLLLRKLRPIDICAPLSLRMGAWVIDLSLVMGSAILLARWWEGRSISPLVMLPLDLRVPYAPFLLVYVLYTVLTEWLACATLGKYLLGLRVITDTGGRPPFWSAALRNLTGLYERIPPLMLVTMALVMFTARRQRLGDLLAKTYVVHRSGLDSMQAQRARDAARGSELEEEPVALAPEKPAPKDDEGKGN